MALWLPTIRTAAAMTRSVRRAGGGAALYFATAHTNDNAARRLRPRARVAHARPSVAGADAGLRRHSAASAKKARTGLPTDNCACAACQGTLPSWRGAAAAAPRPQGQGVTRGRLP